VAETWLLARLPAGGRGMQNHVETALLAFSGVGPCVAAGGRRVSSRVENLNLPIPVVSAPGRSHGRVRVRRTRLRGRGDGQMASRSAGSPAGSMSGSIDARPVAGQPRAA
jgi:hypothetical protein